MFDSAHDAELVWHEGEQAWWLIYLQNRYNSPLADPGGSCPYCSFTDIGLASSADGGWTWVYRGVAQGLDVPPALRNRSSPATRPPAMTSQQYGGATWWRPAVVRHEGVYHGFFVYNPDPGAGFGAASIMHYTSDDLKHWRFAEVARSSHPSAYDSNVFKMAGGRFILFSTGQDRTRTPPLREARPLQSTTLYNWSECMDPSLQINVGEGPHVTGSALNDATTEWNGYAWMNWQGGNVLRSSDGGVRWEKQPHGLFLKDSGNCGGQTPTDVGVPGQGPLLVAGSPSEMYALYFTEFGTTAAAGTIGRTLFSRRSVLHLTKARFTQGWLTCNRSSLHGRISHARGTASVPPHAPPEQALLPPPADANASAAHARPPLHIAADEAVVVALAELNRWHGGWFVHEALLTGPWVVGVYHAFRLNAPYYRMQHAPSAEACVALCRAEAGAGAGAGAGGGDCGGVVFKEEATPSGPIYPAGTNCSVGSTCCYLMSHVSLGPDPQAECPVPCEGWDSWADVGIINCTAQAIDSLRNTDASATAHVGNHTPITPGKCVPFGAYRPGFGAWRDPAVARTLFSSINAVGVGASMVWKLGLRRIVSNTTRQVLAYDFVVAGNATILQMVNRSADATILQMTNRSADDRAAGKRGRRRLVSPLTQFLRSPPFTP